MTTTTSSPADAAAPSATPAPPLIYPRALRPGDAVRVIAPAGPSEPPLLWRALGWLREQGFRVRYDRGIFSRLSYLAGDDARRRDELQAAIQEPDVAAVLCARGGYGVSRIAHQIDWSPLRLAPRWFIGFSDITAIHVEAARQGVASLHGCNAGGVGRADQRARDDLLASLHAPLAPRRHALTTLTPGHARAALFGGNLSLLHACAAAGRLTLPDPCVLFLEDIGEQPYRLDRAITTLLAGDHLRTVAAVVLGQFTDCGGPPGDSRAAIALLHERLAPLGVPIAAGLQAGHELPNHALTLLQIAQLHATAASAELRLGG